MIAERYYTVAEVAVCLAVSRSVVYRAIQSGDLQPTVVGQRTLRISERALTAFESRRTLLSQACPS